jgi:hypothetical protein
MLKYYKIKVNIALVLVSRNFNIKRVNLVELAREYDVPYLYLIARVNSYRSRSIRDLIYRTFNNK